MVGGGCGSQGLLNLNPTTVLVVLMLGLWLVLGCDNCSIKLFHLQVSIKSLAKDN